MDKGYGVFDKTKLQAAIKDATLFWQQKLGASLWFFEEPREDREEVMAISWADFYRHGAIVYRPAADKLWRTIANQTIPQLVLHEVTHVLLAPVRESVEAGLAGPWKKVITDSLETACDTTATAFYNLATPEERANLTNLFAAARKP